MLTRQALQASARAQRIVASSLTRQARGAQQVRFSSELFGKEFIEHRQHVQDHAGKSTDMWRKITYYFCLPFCGVMAFYIGRIEMEHIRHRDHEIEENGGEIPERPKYEYNDMRKKPMPWAGDGHDNCFFFNPKANRDITI